jgi:hypothetical protein
MRPDPALYFQKKVKRLIGRDATTVFGKLPATQAIPPVEFEKSSCEKFEIVLRCAKHQRFKW